MEQFKRTKVIMLPTNNKSNIFYFEGTNRLGWFKKPDLPKALQLEAQHLSIISDNEIKEGDWYYSIQGNRILQATIKDIEIFKRTPEILIAYKKVIATTDLLDRNYELDRQLPQPSQQFIEYYIEEYNKGNIITNVLVEYEDIIYNPEKDKEYQSNDRINIEDCDKQSRLKINPKDNTITIKEVKNSWNKEEIEELCRLAFKAGINKHKALMEYQQNSESDEANIKFINTLGEDRWIEENL